MKVIKTQLPVMHIDLVKIFLDANKLDIEVSHYTSGYHNLISLEYAVNEELENKMTYMSIKHSGFLNMIDDFLLKCGVYPEHLRTWIAVD